MANVRAPARACRAVNYEDKGVPADGSVLRLLPWQFSRLEIIEPVNGAKRLRMSILAQRFRVRPAERLDRRERPTNAAEGEGGMKIDFIKGLAFAAMLTPAVAQAQ